MPANELLSAVILAIAHATDDVEVAAAGLEALTSTIGAAGGVIWLSEGDSLARVAVTGDRDAIEAIEADIDPARLPAALADRRSSVVVSPVPGGRVAVVPLNAGDDTVGLLALVVRDEGEPRATAGLARHLPLAVEAMAHSIRRRRSDAATRWELDRSRALYAVAARLEAAVEHDEIVQFVAERTTELIGAQFGAFFYNIVDDGGESYLHYALAGEVGRETFAGYPLPRSTGLFERTFRGQETIRLADVTTDPRYGRNRPYCGIPAGHPPVRSFLAVPVVSRAGEVVGSLLFGHEDVGVFGAGDERLAERISRHAAAAIDHARRHQSEHDLADALQHSLLPQVLPAPPGVHLGVAYRSAGDRVDVGGDWYDAVQLDDGRLALTVGDVVGHNLRAAVAMGQIRVALRVYAFEDGRPGRCLDRLERFVRSTETTPMATVVMALFDPASSILTVASAGHPPPVLARAGQPARLLDLDVAPPIGTGLLKSGEVGEVDVALEPGDTVLLFTDGLVERRGEVLDEGFARLLAATDAAAHLDVHALTGHLIGQLVDPGEHRDDTALLALRVSAG